MQAAGKTFLPLAVETLGGWRDQEAGQGQSAQLTKRYPWCAGGVLEPCHGLQVSGHSTPAVSSVLICPPPAAWLPASHLPALCGEMGPVLPSHTALSSTLAAPHDIMLHTSDGAPQPCQHFI